MSQTKSDWKNNAVANSQQLSAKIEETFHKSMKSGREAIENATDDDLRELLMINIDYLVGTAIALTAQYVNSGEEFEGRVVDLVKEKFDLLRKMEAEKNGSQK